MSGCVHMNPEDSCASCAPEKLLRVRAWLRSISDDLVTQIIARAEKAEAERDAAGAALCAAMPPTPGTKDRTLGALVTQIIKERDEARELEAIARSRMTYLAAYHDHTALDRTSKELRRERDELAEHERQTHERMGAILGTDDSMERCAERLRAKYDAALVVLRALELRTMSRNIGDTWNVESPHVRGYVHVPAEWNIICSDVESKP